MAKLKGIKKIDKLINKFTKQFGITANLGTEFQAFCDDHTIEYTLVIAEEDIKYFIEDAEKRYPDIKTDIFLWCLLHEIGHIITDVLWTDEELEYFEAQKNEMMCYSDTDLRNNWYHCIPDEFFATRWAGNYMRKHPKKIANFWAEMQAEIIKFYKKNGLLEEND